MPEQLEHISASPIKVPDVVIGRLPQYVRILNQLKQILAINNNWSVLLIGVERLGRAILSYPGFTPNGFHIVAAADSDPTIIGQTIECFAINALNTVSTLARNHSIDISIVAVPIQRTQSVIDELVEYGITAILSYAPITPHVPSEFRILTEYYRYNL